MFIYRHKKITALYFTTQKRLLSILVLGENIKLEERTLYIVQLI